MKTKIIRYHLTPARTAVIQKFKNNKCWQGCGDKGTLINTLLVGMQISTGIVENCTEIHQKIKWIYHMSQLPHNFWEYIQRY